MKKLLLVGAILVGAASASQAGINFHIGISLPLPRLPIIIRQAEAVCAPSVVIAPPVCPPRVIASSPVCAPRVVAPYSPPVHYRPAYGYGYVSPGRSHERGRDRYYGRGNERWR